MMRRNACSDNKGAYTQFELKFKEWTNISKQAEQTNKQTNKQIDDRTRDDIQFSLSLYCSIYVTCPSLCPSLDCLDECSENDEILVLVDFDAAHGRKDVAEDAGAVRLVRLVHLGDDLIGANLDRVFVKRPWAEYLYYRRDVLVRQVWSQ